MTNRGTTTDTFKTINELHLHPSEYRVTQRNERRCQSLPRNIRCRSSWSTWKSIPVRQSNLQQQLISGPIMVTGSTTAESMVPEPKIEDDKEDISVIFVDADATVTRLIQCQRRTRRAEVELGGRLG